MSDVRISYDSNKFAYNGDGQSNPARPTRGNATLAQEVSAASGATPTAFVDTAATTYDSYGRVASTTRTPNSKAADGTTSIARTTYTRYAPASGALPEKFTTVTQVTAGANCATVTESSKDCQVGTATMSPGRQLAIAGTDVAGALTSQTYDALGRLTAVWLPNKSKAAGAPANLLYTYLLSATAPSVVTARKLLDSDQAGGSPAYSTSKTLYDAMLRTLETQETSHNGTVTVSDVQYDSHGRKVLTNNSYAAAGTPSDTLVSDRLSLVSVPDTTVTDHDALGRVTQVTAQHKGVEKWRTRTAYTGDKVTVLPPQGDVATTTTTDARGRTTKLEHYTARPTMTGDLRSGFTATGGTSNRILYTYTASGLQSTVTGPDDSVWRFSYDIRGRRTSLVDPDIGTNLTGYDDAGNVLTTKDARGIQLDFTYDLLGRKLAATDRSKSNFKYASWAYDTLRIGKPTSSTRFVSGVTGGYKVEVTGYSVLGNPLGQTLSLPTVEKPLPTEYTTTFAYTPNTEMLAQQQDPTVAGLGGETITYGYNSLGAPIRTSGTELYVSGALYTDFGQLSRVTMGASTNEAQAIYSYDEQTLRLAGRTVYRAQGPGPQIDETKYTYDEAGNPLSVTNVQSETGNTITDRQCYQYDALARLAEAWTAKDACAAAPAASEVSAGAGAYWQSFTYNAIGDRTRVVDHSSSGGADVVTGYENGCLTGCNRTGKQPHTLTATTGGGDPTKFVYDAAGNLLTRTPTTAAGQTLKWDDEGSLAEVTTTGATPTTTKYLYDADGNQLIRRDPGRTTLFAGDTEVVIDTSVTPARELGAVRSYKLGGGGPQAAVRSSLPGGGTHYMFHDPHGTGTLAMDTTTQQVSRQQTKPYGEPRSTANPTIWPDSTRGFLGAPKSTHTGYTDVGARKYDPGLGRFISADPLMIMDSGQLGGYTYSGDNPMGFSDPSGLGRVDGDRPGCAPGNGGTCGGYVTEDDYFDEPSGPEKPGRGRSNEKADRGCFGTCDGRMVLYKNIVLPAELGAEKQQRIATRFYKSYRELFCYRNGYCEEADQLLPLQFMIMLKGVCSAEGGCGKDIDEMVTFPKLLGQAVQDNAFGGGEGSLAGGAGMPITTSAVGGKGTIAPPSAVTPACRNSFTPDTLVLMADGSTKPIKDVKLGDKVLATDPETGETAAKPVTVLHDNLDHDFVNLTVIDEDGDRAIIRTTYHHPFWNEAAREWVDAGRLSAGTALRSVGAQEAWAVQAHVFSGSRQMLNLTVADIRTYYVLAGDTPVLVHNTPPTCPKNGGKLSSPLPKGMSDEIADAYDAVKRGELVSHDTYVGREHPAWGGAAEYAIPGRPDNERILVKTYPSGVKKIGWTSTHYRKIQQFEAPHFPDSGWIPPNR